MRRLFVVVLCVAALALPSIGAAPPAGAATAGACTFNASENYQPRLWPLTMPPQGFGLALGLALTCVGANTSTWVLAGQGSGIGSCAAEVSSAQLTGAGVAATATWVRVGAVGWMIVQILAAGGPSSQYAYEGPLVWLPNGDCLTSGPSSASMAGAGPHMGL